MLQDQMENIAKQLAQNAEDELIRFLKSKGYIPKRTAKYAKYLKHKLEKQGLELIELESREPYETHCERTYGMNVKYWFEIRRKRL